MKCWTLDFGSCGAKRRRKQAGGALGPATLSSELPGSDGAGEPRLASRRSGHRLGHSPAPSTVSELDYFDAKSDIADGAGSPPGALTPGASPLHQANGGFQQSLDAERRRSGLGATPSHSPKATVWDRAALLLRRDASRSWRAGSTEGPGKQVHAIEEAALDEQGKAEPPPDAVMEPEEPGATCLPALPLFTSHSGHRRFIRTLKPPAGSSFKRRHAPAGQVDGIECWEEADATAFCVRGRDYMQTRAKVPSAPAIYRLLGVDIYSFDFKISHIARHIRLPDAPPVGPAALARPPERRVPPLLIINVQLPMYPASLFGGASDGHGHSLVYYFGLPPGWEPAHAGSDAAVGLLERLVHNGVESDGTPTRERLKLIPRVANADAWAREAPLSAAERRLLLNYNDKPLLTRPQHKFYVAPDLSYMEVDVDVHAYAYLARKALQAFIPRLGSVVFETAFVIQGNREEELPEAVLACARVSRVDFKQVRPFPARLERTASRGRLVVQGGSPTGSARHQPVAAGA